MKLNQSKSYWSDGIYLIFLIVILIIAIFMYKSTNLKQEIFNHTNSTISITNAKYHIKTKGVNNKEINTPLTVIQDVYLNKLHEKEEFLPAKDFALLVITVFSYLLIFTLVSMLKQYRNIYSDIEMHNEIIKILENKIAQANEEHNENSKKLKSLIKQIKEIHMFNKKDKYKPTIQNLAKLYKVYYAVQEEFEKGNNKEINTFLKNQLDEIQKNLKDNNILFIKILTSLKYKNTPQEYRSIRQKELLYKHYEVLNQYDVNNELEIPYASLKQVLELYIQLKNELTEVKFHTIEAEKYLEEAILLIEKKLQESDKQDTSIKKIKNVFSAYTIVIYKSNNKNLKDINQIYKKLLKLIEYKKYTKSTWSTILEIIEEKAHHSLLSDFKTHDLRLRPYSIKSLTYDMTEIINESKILNVYYKIYNILIPLKETVLQNMTNKVDDKLIQFITYKIEELQKHRYSTILYFLQKYLIYFIAFASTLLLFLAFISLIIQERGKAFDVHELFLMNELFLLNFFIIFLVAYMYFLFKKLVYSKFSLYKNKIGHYINNISLLFISISIIIYADIQSEKNIVEYNNIHNFAVYGDIVKKFGQLLLPSSFSDLHNTYELAPMQILVYKVVFLLVFGYFVFTFINFLIHKYDAIYFSKQKKTLIPPELALISINFLLSILFLGLLYGTYMHYLDALNYVDTYSQSETIIQGSFSGDEEAESNYIPFSIFIAVIGGLLTMATRDLLENYFAGISLQMDSPYEEHDRITINDSKMLEVKHIGIRADRFYDIKANAILVIPHKKLIDETIVNFTLPTLDYRHELTIYIPHVDKNDDNQRSLPKRAEMLLLLSIFVNTGVKIPFLGFKKKNTLGVLPKRVNKTLKTYGVIINLLLREKNSEKNTEENLEKNLTLEELELDSNSEIYQNIEKVLNELSDEEDKSYKNIIKKYILKIWEDLRNVYEQDEDDIVDNPLKKLFIFKLIKAVEEAENDQDEKHELEEKEMIFKIKSTVVSILLSLEKYEEMSEKLYHHYDANLVLRKYKMFREEYKNKYKKENDRSILHDMARELVNINYYYFDLASSLWKLKELQNSLYRKREIDSTSLELLDVPRVTTEHIYSGEGTINYWKVTADITLELSEQSSEVIHHINMYVDNLWDDFELPKYYKRENKKVTSKKSSLLGL